MRLRLTEQAPLSRWSPRPFEPSDVAAIGTLLLAAYRGTVHDEGETESDAVAEVKSTIDGAYGPFLHEASFVVEEGGRSLGASLVTLYESLPFLAHIVVHPDMQRRGIGTLLIEASGKALHSASHAEMELIVTEANESAVNLYRKLGFRQVDRLMQPPASP
jgi:ribosomal protein S18 acetylase RimI-like enzyme